MTEPVRLSKPGATVDALLKQVPNINNVNKRSYIVAGVIRYSAASQNWEQIGGDHAPLNTVSVECPTDLTLKINFGLSAVLNKKVVSFVANCDEDLAELGMFVGASVATNSATLQTFTGSHGAYIYYSNDAWVELIGTAFAASTLEWVTDHLVITLPYALVDAYIKDWPQVSGRNGAYNPKLGSIGTNTVTVYFYDNAGALVTTPDNSMKVYVSYGLRKLNTKGAAGPKDGFGNIWYMGIIEGDA